MKRCLHSVQDVTSVPSLSRGKLIIRFSPSHQLGRVSNLNNVKISYIIRVNFLIHSGAIHATVIRHFCLHDSGRLSD